MSKVRLRFVLIVFAAALLGGVLICGAGGGKWDSIEQWEDAGRAARIRPDYSGTVIPANIAPMNFLVDEEGTEYCVRIYSKKGGPIEILSRSPKIVVRENAWHELLDANRGEELSVDILVKHPQKRWERFDTIRNRIAREDVDGYVVYRKLYPTHILANGNLGIYERNLQNYKERVLLDRGYEKQRCLNCHAFCRNRTDKMLLGVRSSIHGVCTVLVDNGKVHRIGTKFGYSSWHPSGQLAAYSVNQLRLAYHTGTREVRDTIDLNSFLAYYVVESGTVKTNAQISQKDRLETWPSWSPDGRYLYFSSAPVLWSETDEEFPPKRYRELKYDIVRISYDIERDEWGEVETILSAEQTGKSMLVPRISPDGRWLVCAGCDYGAFAAWQPNSDFYIVDLKAGEETGRYEARRLEINSEHSESWCSWSSNGRWIAFSSKRDGGVFTRCYLSYVDEQGNVHKPLVIPQKDPTYYDSCLETYNTCELVIEPVPVGRMELTAVVRSDEEIAVELPITMATPQAPAASGSYEYGQQAE